MSLRDPNLYKMPLKFYLTSITDTNTPFLMSHTSFRRISLKGPPVGEAPQKTAAASVCRPEPLARPLALIVLSWAGSEVIRRDLLQVVNVTLVKV